MIADLGRLGRRRVCALSSMFCARGGGRVPYLMKPCSAAWRTSCIVLFLGEHVPGAIWDAVPHRVSQSQAQGFL